MTKMKQPNLKKQQKLEYKLVETEGQLEYIARLKASARIASNLKKLKKRERRLARKRELLLMHLSAEEQWIPENRAYLKARRHRTILLVLLSVSLLFSLIMLNTSIRYGSTTTYFFMKFDPGFQSMAGYITHYSHDYSSILWLILSSVISAGIVAVMILVNKFIKLCAPASKPYKEREHLI